MIEYGFGRRFHDLKYIKVGFFFPLELIIYLRALLQKIVENHQFNVILSYLNVGKCRHLNKNSYLHHLLKYVDFSWNCYCHHKLLGFVNQHVVI